MNKILLFLQARVHKINQLSLYKLINLLFLIVIIQVQHFQLDAQELVPIEAVPGQLPCANLFSSIKYVRRSQVNYFNIYTALYEKINQRESYAANNLYTYTAKYKKRLYKWDNELLGLLKYYTGWDQPVGITMDPQKNLTYVVMPADPSIVKSIQVNFYNTPFDIDPQYSFSLQNDADNPILWKAAISANLEGKWYDFTYFSQPNSQALIAPGLLEDIPPSYTVLDPFAYKVAYQKAQVWFPPIPEARPDLHQTSEPLLIIELDLSDLNPPDVSPQIWGTWSAFSHSVYLQKLIAPFNAVEVMPARSATFCEAITSDPVNAPLKQDVLYIHYWGYMPNSFAVSNMKGGVESQLEMIDSLHSMGVRVLKDEVLQHFANRRYNTDKFLILFYYALKNMFRHPDITGCGNTTNLQRNSLFTKLSIQMLLRDILVYKFDGHRHDLMGAIPRDTAELFKYLNHSLNAFISGEPYAIPYELSEWNTDKNPLRDAGLWDHRYKDMMRSLIKYGGTAEQLISLISGGHPWSWVQKSSDRVAILETHDGETLAHYLGNDYKKMAHALAIHMSNQGSVLVSGSQLVGVYHHHLDNTPIDLFNLTWEQQVFKEYALKLIQLRKKYNLYFAFPWLEENINVQYLKIANNNQALGVLIPKPARGTQKEQILILYNLSSQWVTFNIPEGSWDTMVDSSAIKADTELSIYPPATNKTYNVAPYSTVWLLKKS